MKFNKKIADSITEKLSRDKWEQDPPMLTPEEAAWYIEMRPSNLNKLLAAGRGPNFYLVYGELLISMNDLALRRIERQYSRA